MQQEVSDTPLKIFIPYKALSVVFGVITVITIWASLYWGFRSSFPMAVMFAALAGIDGILACGLWKMKKWIVPLMGGSLVLVSAINFFGVSKGTRGLNQALLAFLILGALFILTYLSRSYLKGEYANRKVLGSVLALIILSQLATFFLK